MASVVAASSTDPAKVGETQPTDRTRRWVIAVTLALIILLAAFLRFYELGAEGIGNAYYGATVKSMLTSWKNFFYASYEPGGSVTVDKPPLGLWVQAVSAFLLGVNGFALALPQAIAGVLSVPLLFYLVKRQFGEWPGLLAALSLAILPASIATERNNTMDGLLVFVLLLAAWAFIESVRRGRFRYLLLGAFIVGLGFNIKMLQALMPLPAFYALYFVGAPHKWWKRIVHLAAASVLLIAVSLAWAVAVDLTPAEDRPFVGSSKTNSMLELIMGHNGIRRLTSDAVARSDGPAGTADGPRQVPPLRPDGAGTIYPPTFPDGAPPAQLPPNDGIYPPAGNPRGQRPPRPDMTQNQGPGVDGPGDAANRTPFSQEVGQAGALRMFTAPLVDEASWLLPFVLLGLPILIAVLGVGWPLNEKQLGVILWGGWLLPAFIYFSFTTGLLHDQQPTSLAGVDPDRFADSRNGPCSGIRRNQLPRLRGTDHLGWIAVVAGRICAARIAEMGSHPQGRLRPAHRCTRRRTDGLVLRDDIQSQRQCWSSKRRPGYRQRQPAWRHVRAFTGSGDHTRVPAYQHRL
jgi:4-amino-4-deoxy-L-arabinose transferase-like glycosyltransferase